VGTVKPLNCVGKVQYNETVRLKSAMGTVQPLNCVGTVQYNGTVQKLVTVRKTNIPKTFSPLLCTRGPRLLVLAASLFLVRSFTVRKRFLPVRR